MTGALGLLSMGFVLGLRHALDADHLAAVSTLVARERRVRAAAFVGLAWGLGHSATVLLLGGTMLAVGVVLPARVAGALELGVALMLVVLGGAGLRRLSRPASVAEASSPGASHAEAGAHHRRPFAVGVVHGLAGSAAVALLVLGTVEDRLTGLAYLATFSVGTLLGMVLVTAGFAVPLALAARRLAPGWLRSAMLATSLASLALGVWTAYRVGVEDALLRDQVVARFP